MRRILFGLAFGVLVSAALGKLPNDGPSLERGRALDWDRFLLSESDPVPNYEEEPVAFDAAIVSYSALLLAFENAVSEFGAPPLPSEISVARFKHTMTALTYRAMRDLELGRTKAAYRDCMTLLELAEAFGRRPEEQAQFMSVSATGMVVFPAGAGIDQGWSDRQLASLQSRLLKLHPVSNYIAMLASGAELMESGESETFGDPREAIPFWDVRANTIRKGEDSYRLSKGAVADMCNIDVRMRWTALALALERHRRDHGEVPDRLEDLVPQVCRTSPLNPWTGGAFHYQKLAAGNAQLDGDGADDSFTLR